MLDLEALIPFLLGKQKTCSDKIREDSVLTDLGETLNAMRLGEREEQ